MKMYDIIEKKRDNKELTKEEIDFWISGYVNGIIPDYQVSSLLMAIYFNGLSDEELVNLSFAMANSGDIVDLSEVNGIKVDKHSTGGVGDKTTIVVASIAAACGCKIAKMSGRGLGFTGGTADKLESIQGYKINLDRNDFIKQVNDIGISLITQSGNLVPADKKLYALRDVTATVESIPLIASSIMSKKIASGADVIVLDVKVGKGAFMKDISSAKELSNKMVQIGKLAGRKTVAIITNMDVPLGNEIGNSLEIKEVIEVLNGNGPKDLTEICIKLATYMVMLGNNISEEEAKNLAQKSIESKTAFNKFKELVKAQGGNVEWIENTELFPKSNINIQVVSEKTGYITSMNTELIGKISCNLGAGRETKEDKIDYSAGITVLKKTGDFVEQGQILAVLHTNLEDKIDEAKKAYLKALNIEQNKPENSILIYEVIE